MTPKPVSQRLTATDARILTAARRVLHRLEDDASPSRDLDAHDNYRLGIFNEACERAEQTLFEALSIAANRLDCGIAKIALRENIYSGLG